MPGSVLGAGSLGEPNKGPVLWNTVRHARPGQSALARRAGQDLLFAVCAYKRDSLVSHVRAAEQKRPVDVGGQLLEQVQ